MQITLFGEQKKEEKKVFSKPEKITPSNIFSEELEEIKKDETFAAAYIKRIIVSTLDKREITLSTNFEFSINPYPQENSTYGGFYQFLDFSEDRIPELLKYLTEFKKRLLELPYTDDLKNADRYTNLKHSNVFIKISDETKKFIEEKANIKWEEYLENFSKIKNKIIPENYNNLVQEEYRLEKEIKIKKKEISELKENYSKIIEEDSPTLATFEKEPSKIFNAWKEAKSDLANLEKELKEMTNKINNVANEGDAP